MKPNERPTATECRKAMNELGRQNLMNANNYANALKGFIMKDLNLDIKVSTVGEDDRADLEGKLITFYDEDGAHPAVVIGCNKSVGITIVNANDPDDKYLCVRGPVIPVNTVSAHINYDDSWKVMVQMIENGHYYLDTHYELRKDTGGMGSMSCAYSM